MNKNFLITVFVVIATGLAFTTSYYRDELVTAKDGLETAQAKYDTGACGTAFSVPIGDGHVFAVAGELVPAEELRLYSRRPSEDGRSEEIVQKDKDGRETVLVRQSR